MIESGECMNRVILMGRLTADPELRQTPQGTTLARFTIAVNRRFAKEGSQQADFINCVAWRLTGEFVARYFHKGSMIAVEGQIQSRSWDGQDGRRQYATEVVVDNAYFTGSKAETNTGASQGAYQSNFGAYSAPADHGFNQAPAHTDYDQGFTDLTLSGDAGSEDDLPF